MYLRGTLCMAALAGVVQSTSHICLAQSPMKSSDHLIWMIQKWIVWSTCEKCSGAPSPPNQLSSKIKCPPLTPLSPSYWPSRFWVSVAPLAWARETLISAEATRPRWSFVEISSNQAEIQNLNPPSQKRCNTQLVAVSNQAGSGKSRVAAVRWWSCSTAELQRAAPTRLCSLLSTPEQNSGRLPPLSFPVRCFDQKIPCSTLKVDFAYDCSLRQQIFSADYVFWNKAIT